MPTSRKYRTALVAALLDLLDFVDEKLREALDEPTSQLRLQQRQDALCR